MNLFARIRAHGITSDELAACEVAATMMARAEVPADATLKERLPGLHWRREVTLLAIVLDIAKADGWLPPRPASNPRGGRPRNGKLTAEDVRAIRGSSGRMRIAQLAEKYGVSTATISRILADRTYLAVS